MSEGMNTIATDMQTAAETRYARELPRPDPAAFEESPASSHRRRLRQEISEWVREPTVQEPTEPILDEEVEEFVRTEAEKDAAERAAARVITNLEQRRAAKEPMRQRQIMEYIEERPDLNMYFNDFPYEITDQERIKICRAYASYLVSLQPPPPPRTKKAKK